MIRSPLVLRLTLACAVAALGAPAVRAQKAAPDSSGFLPPDSVHAPARLIVIIGNRKTHPSVILREMTFHAGDSVTGAALRESQERIYNLGLFNTVDVAAMADTTTHAVDVLVFVRERWYIWPQLVLGVKDRDWQHIFTHGSKVYAGLGVTDFNLRGRREKGFLGFALGYDPWVRFEYSFLALDAARNWMLDGALAASRILNQSDTLYTHGYGFDEISYDVSAYCYRRLSRRFAAGVRAGFTSLHLSNPDARLTLNPAGTDNVPYAGAEATYDSRDDADYAMRGAWLFGLVRKYGAGTDINYARAAADVRVFSDVGPLTIAARAMADVAFGGNVPVYDHQFLGLAERVRGEYFTKREGEDVALGSLELRIPLVRQLHLVWDAPSWMPNEFTATQLTIALALFADAGLTCFRGERLAEQRLSNGVGAGIHVVLPYGNVARFEYAFHGAPGQGQFIFDLQQSF